MRICIAIAIVYLCLAAAAYFASDRLIFQPHASSYRDDASIIKLETKGGKRISAVYLSNPDARYTLLYHHGNGEDLGDILPMLRLYQEHGVSVFAYDYQGYGTSEGTPSEEGAYRDADAAYAYLTETLRIPASAVIIYGRSLGGAVAIDLASRKPAAALIVESTFVTAYRVLTRLPLFPFDRFKSLDKISKVHVPVLVMHGKKDRLISFWHGLTLFERANEPKSSLWVDGAGHNNLYHTAPEAYWAAFKNFLQSL